MKLVWDSSQPGKGVVELGPGEYKELQWVFTKPGTYLMWVHLLGDVKDPPAGASWNRISSKDTETSEVYRYTIHVGPLTLDEQPAFYVERSVDENSAADTPVGPPLKVIGIGGDTLAGDGSDNFAVNAVGEGAQIVVAPGAALDYETTRSYDLTLGVSDSKARTGYSDYETDSVIAVRVALQDVNDNPRVDLSVDTQTPSTGDTVTFTATVSYASVPAEKLRYTATQHDVDGTGLWKATQLSEPTWTVTHHTPGLRRFHILAHYTDAQGNVARLRSETIEVTWVNP